MKPVRRQTDAELHWNINDCDEAISAMPRNPKVCDYIIQRRACIDELLVRSHKRAARRMVRETIDPLHSPGMTRARRRGWIVNSGFRIDQAKSGAWLIGWYRRQERQKGAAG